jgi:deoxyribodipyrimidine photo-lyase
VDHETAIVWFRDDLRVHDNEALVRGADAEELLPVYAFDPRSFGQREYGGPGSFEFRKTGGHRARFLVESVADLRSSLRTRGSDLIVREGRPESVLPELAQAVDADAVHFHEFPTPEERVVETALKDSLRERGVTPQRYWGHTLYHVRDLPTPPGRIDDTFTPFRERVENEAAVREPFETPSLSSLPGAVGEGIDPGSIPDPRELDPELAVPEADDRGALPFRGGETRGLDRLREYVWERDCLREYKRTRNGLVGADYSSKLSPWLNRGCLSPRRVHAAVREYEAERVSNDSTYWLLFELVWRDFFQFQFEKHGSQHFRLEGIRERTDLDWRGDGEAFRRWAAGETGVPFVDAAMRELNATGYQSNRARQNAASYLANDLRVDWRRGAAYFETRLVDYDPASNYGNWAYVAGVGNDSRNRSFDVLSQAKRYDGDAEYVKLWVPELEALPPELAHAPWRLSDREAEEYGVDYPDPLVEP